MARCNTQTREKNQEEVQINGKTFFGTFGNPELMPVQTRHGYQDHLVNVLILSRDQFATAPESRQMVLRVQTKRNFFVQMVDHTNPVVFTLILTDREV